MSEEIKNGMLTIADTADAITRAARTDKVKYGVNFISFGKEILNAQFTTAVEFAKSAMMSGSYRSETVDALAERCLDLADAMFAKGRARNWVTPLDMDAVKRLEEAELESSFAGIAPGRR